MVKNWSDYLEDSIRRYLDEDITVTKSVYSNIPVNPCYGITPYRPQIKKVIFNDPATIILWNDGTKSVVKCQFGEVYDSEKGFVMAYLKKLLGNDNTFNKEIHKWVTQHE